MNINEPVQGKLFALPFTKAADPNAELTDADYRLPFARRLPDHVRNHFIAMCGEFVGTFLFLFFALSGTQVANSVNTSSGASEAVVGSNPQQLQYIALCFGFSLAVNAWVFFRISGGLFNPAVTVGMCLIGALPWFRGVLLFFTQLCGGMAAAGIVSCLFPGALNVRTTLGGGTSVVQGLFIEMFLTAQLVFTIFMLAAEKHKGTFIAPVGIGLALFIAELTGLYFTGGSLNPARSFGPAVVDATFDSYHWIYWLGPLLGSLIAAGFYKFIKALEYETANPGQDDSHARVVERKKQLLVAAGLPQEEAHIVAHDLADTAAAANAGGVDGTIMAQGQGRKDIETGEAMYGSNFASNGTPPATTTMNDAAAFPQYRSRAGTEESSSEKTLARPDLQNTGYSTQTRLGFLRGAARRASELNSNAAPNNLDYGGIEGRVESPAMATHDELYAPLVTEPAERLGGLTNPNDLPKRENSIAGNSMRGNSLKGRFARTPSSNV